MEVFARLAYAARANDENAYMAVVGIRDAIEMLESYRDDQVFLHIPAGCQRTCGPPVSHDLSQGRELAHHQIVGNSLRVGSLAALCPGAADLSLVRRQGTRIRVLWL